MSPKVPLSPFIRRRIRASIDRIRAGVTTSTPTDTTPRPFPKIKKPKGYSFLVPLFLYVAFAIGFVVVVGGIFVYYAYIASLPPISSLEADVLPESSVIYDRNGNELYTLYAKEKRTYVTIDKISPNMAHAMVSTEDKDFYNNPGIELKSFVRAGYNYVLGRSDRVAGTSTISQQLIKNIFLSNERSVTRKIKEAYLSYALNKTYTKDKILELYLNKISFGSNAYGIEQASKTFFGKSASDLGILGSSILASIPKGPTEFSPYTNRSRLMGYMSVISSGSGASDTTSLDTIDQIHQYQPLVDIFKGYLSNLKLTTVDASHIHICKIPTGTLGKTYSVKDGCITVQYPDLFPLISSIHITPGGDRDPTLTGLTLTYTAGRKDFVLGRMLEDKYISPDDYIKTLVAGLEFQFEPYSENIKHPHFIFYVKEYLEEKYGKEFLDQGGLKIYTTLDPDLQNKAEEIVDAMATTNETRYHASDAALVSMDNKTGQILTMVGGRDYFNTTRNGANVNVITSKRQPGSAFKPIIYSLAFSKAPIGPDTPIYDLPTKFGNWKPNNYDNQFMGRMSVKKAVGYSRNIPAAKMFYVAGGEQSVVEYARALGILSLQPNASYGAPLAIGTGELKPLELMEAYSVFANGGVRKDPTPILKIVDSRGNVLDQYMDTAGKAVLSDAAAYLMTSVLSDPANRPNAFWNNNLTLSDRTVAAKTGTSNKEETKKDGAKYIVPRDLWTAGYSPQITTIVWAGNNNGDGTSTSGDGLNCAAPIWHDFMEYAHKKLAVEDFVKPASVISATISNISGRLVGTSSPSDVRVSSIFAVQPKDYEITGQEVDVDQLCDGKVTADTPEGAIRHGYLADVTPIIDSTDPSWLPSVRTWISDNLGESLATSNLIIHYDTTPCTRPKKDASKITVTANLQPNSSLSLGRHRLEISYRATNIVTKLQLLRDNNLVAEYPTDGTSSSGTFVKDDMDFDASWSGAHVVTVRAIDQYYYVGQSSYLIGFVKDTSGPTITVDTGSGSSAIQMLRVESRDLRIHIESSQPLLATSVFINGNLAKILGDGTDLVYTFNATKDITPGTYSLRIQSTDAAFHTTNQTMMVQVE